MSGRGNVPAPYDPRTHISYKKDANPAEEFELVFDAPNLSFVDDWLKDEGPSKAKPITSSQDTEHGRYGRQGLGSSVLKKPGFDDSNIGMTAILEKRIDKKKKRDNAGDVLLHSNSPDKDSSDDPYESRTKSISKISKRSISSYTPPSSISTEHCLNKNIKHTRKISSKLKLNNDVGILEPPPERLSEESNNFQNNSVEDDKKKSNVQAEQRPNIHRKRGKTRSRQKNIRKDKRDVSQRPQYLQPGTEHYCGHPLTEETSTYLAKSAN